MDFKIDTSVFSFDSFGSVKLIKYLNEEYYDSIPTLPIQAHVVQRIFKVRHTGSFMAVKILHSSLESTENIKHLQSISKFNNHSNIVRFLGFVKNDKCLNHFAYAMEWMDCGTLRETIYDPFQTYSYEDIHSWGRQAALALLWLESNKCLLQHVTSKKLLLSNGRRVLKLSDAFFDYPNYKRTYGLFSLFGGSIIYRLNVYTLGRVILEMTSRKAITKDYFEYLHDRVYKTVNLQTTERLPLDYVIYRCYFQVFNIETLCDLLSNPPPEIHDIPVIMVPLEKSYHPIKSVDKFARDEFTHIKIEDRGVEGRVDKVRHRDLGEVAIKIFYGKSKSIDNMDKEVFLELEILMKKGRNNRNIITVFGYVMDKSNRTIGFAMEYMAGKSVHSAIYDKEASYKLETVLDWALQASNGLVWLHSIKIIHRDVKPKNMLLSEDRTVLKLCDFGLSREKIETSMTLGTGTFAYMAPELINNDKERGRYSDKCDTYSLGISIWEMATRKSPYDGEHNWNLLDRIVRGERPSLADIPPIVACVIEKCFALNPEDRPSAVSLRHHLSASKIKVIIGTYQTYLLLYEKIKQLQFRRIIRMKDMSKYKLFYVYLNKKSLLMVNPRDSGAIRYIEMMTIELDRLIGMYLRKMRDFHIRGCESNRNNIAYRQLRTSDISLEEVEHSWFHRETSNYESNGIFGLPYSTNSRPSKPSTTNSLPDLLSRQQKKHCRLQNQSNINNSPGKCWVPKKKFPIPPFS